MLVAAGLAFSPFPAPRAQSLPGLPSLGSPAAPPAAPASAASLSEWRARLETARASHRRLSELPDGSAPLLAERQIAYARLVALLSSRVAAMQGDVAPGKTADKATLAAPRLAGPPPFDLLEVDALRDHLDLLQSQEAALRGSLRTLESSLEVAIRARADADAALRLRRERASAPQLNDENQATREAQLEFATVMAQVTELVVVQDDEARRAARDRLEALAAPIDQLRAEIGRTKGHLRFAEADLARVLEGLEDERRRTATERARIAQRLLRLESRPDGDADWRKRAVAALRAALQSYGELEALDRLLEVLWRGRQATISSREGPDQEVATRLAGALTETTDQRRRIGEEVRLTRNELRVQQRRLSAMAADDPARAGERQVLDALLTEAEARDRLAETLDRGIQVARHTREDLGIGAAPATFGEWLRTVPDSVGRWAVALWQFELFSATETVHIDGRAVTVDHGVTVGKSIGVLVLLGLGYWLSGRLARGIVTLIGRRMPLSPQLGSVLRRWINSILLLVVLLVVLKLARIPLTAFAFLGGALAIGVGFGAQNVIKNLISGVIILFERKIHVGDIVSVGGMSGTVTTVDLRATTVRGFDGIDAIVPNSTLLENQISNWSGSSPDVRRTIAVGVAYGSDMRRAAQTILRCAQGNPDVLPQPAADVLFEDFGADALVLRLRYWTRLDGPRGGPGVDSDLRFAIHDALAEQGIAIAFPQRDVHLDVPGALRIELAGRMDADATRLAEGGAGAAASARGHA